jgi:Zn ribbon nucleic-acid-binding protein
MKGLFFSGAEHAFTRPTRAAGTPLCPTMHMVSMGEPNWERRIFECLRCGYIDKPKPKSEVPLISDLVFGAEAKPHHRPDLGAKAKSGVLP